MKPPPINNTPKHLTWIGSPNNQCKRRRQATLQSYSRTREEIWRLVASVISLYMYTTYMQPLLLVHTVLADVCSLKSIRSGAVRSPPLRRLLAERRPDILQRNSTSFKLNAGGKSVIIFFLFLFQRSLEFFRCGSSHRVLDVLVCYQLFFGQVPGWLP